MDPLPPNATIGILGGGQLGRMLAVAAAKLGMEVVIFCPEERCPASRVAGEVITAAYDDEAALSDFAARCDVITLEFENIPASAAQFLEAHETPFFPGATALEVSQDRLTEKRFLKELGIETAPFMPVASEAALGVAAEVTGLPAIMKTRRFGYDGKGQQVVHGPEELGAALTAMDGAPAILEGFVGFEREISVLLARGRDGQSAAFDIPENTHADGILRESRVPADLEEAVATEAVKIADRIGDALSYVGVLTVEFFVEPTGALRVNEIAPRVHNSGHWTVEGCLTSQFEAHIRAICGWPLGSMALRAPCRMQNLIGDDVDQWEELVRQGAAVTLYGKRDARPGRKTGHAVWVEG